MVAYYRKVIKIRAEDSPNVKLAFAELGVGSYEEAVKALTEGKRASGEVLVQGVLSWEEYLFRRQTWDKVRQCVGLDGEFYEGAEILLFPPDWLNRAEALGRELASKKRDAIWIGIDTAEGGDNTSMAAGDEWGLIELVSKKTPDTSVIRREAIAFMRKHNVKPENVCFDRGGGGKQIADDMRADGYKVRTVAFGEPLTMELKRGLTPLEDKKEHREERYVYVNRRAEMYGELSLLMDPSRETGHGFAIPPGTIYEELRRQLSVIPKLYDKEGRMRMLPKNKAKAENKEGGEGSREKTLIELIGHSPDETDAVLCMTHVRLHKVKRIVAGAAV